LRPTCRVMDGAPPVDRRVVLEVSAAAGQPRERGSAAGG
jgi:hypothetical protein